MKSSKLICGVVHIRKQCRVCKEWVWTQCTKSPYMCDTCWKSHTDFNCTTGGGRQVVHKDTHSGG